jgi:hypothetical protein
MLRPALSVVFLVAAVSAQAEIKWFGTADRAFAAAKRENKLVMLDIHNGTVQGGAALDPAFSNPRVVAEAKSIVPLRLKSQTDGKALAKRYRVVAFPTLLFLTGEGTAVWRVSGPHGPISLSLEIRKALSMRAGLASYQAALKSGTGSVEALSGAAILAAAVNDPARGSLLLKKALAADPKVKSVRLADACNLVGDCYQNANKPDVAIPYFKRAANSTDDHTKAYALVSVASCFNMKNDPKNAAVWFRKLADMGAKAGDIGDGAAPFTVAPRPRGRKL